METSNALSCRAPPDTMRATLRMKLCETGVDIAVVRLNDGFVVAMQGGCIAVVAALSRSRTLRYLPCRRRIAVAPSYCLSGSSRPGLPFDPGRAAPSCAGHPGRRHGGSG